VGVVLEGTTGGGILGGRDGGGAEGGGRDVESAGGVKLGIGTEGDLDAVAGARRGGGGGESRLAGDDLTTPLKAIELVSGSVPHSLPSKGSFDVAQLD